MDWMYEGVGVVDYSEMKMNYIQRQDKSMTLSTIRSIIGYIIYVDIYSNRILSNFNDKFNPPPD